MSKVKNSKLKDVFNDLEEQQMLAKGLATNSLKEEAINSVLSVSDDKLKEVTNIIDLLNCPVLTNDDIKGIKWFLVGRLQGKLKD